MRRVSFSLAGGLLGVLCLMAGSAWAAPQQGIAMLGAPKYHADFPHFDYANPDVPKGGLLRIGVVGTFDSFNPFIVRGQSVSAAAFSLDRTGVIYEPLMARSWDEPFSLYGLIAQTIDVPPDRSSVTFALNPLAKWHDGRPITADDVIFSYHLLREQGRPNHRAYYKKVAQVERLDDRRVRFSFAKDRIISPLGTTEERIDREMPLIMGLMPVLPRHDWYFRDFNVPTLKTPLGSGPYRIVKFEVGRFVLMHRVPSYWGRDLPTQRGLYNFDQIRFDFYRDDSIALQAFKSGAFDVRRELDPRKWATSYDSPALQRGDMVKARYAHARTEAVTGFALNTRRDVFKDPILREAVFYAFDFGWVNKTLFHGMFRRTMSFFPNADLACVPSEAPPQQEKDIVQSVMKEQKVASPVAASFFNPIDVPTTDSSVQSLRANLLKAQEILRKGGYDWKDGTLYSPKAGRIVEFEILLSDPTDEKTALSWSRTLKRLGIKARVRTVDSAQFQARLMNFDYDVVSARWSNSLSPGNEQMFYWGSAAAKQKGSRNYAGVQDPLVDALARSIPSVKSREELVTTARALDRALLAGRYVVPFYHLGADYIAYWATRVMAAPSTSAYGPYPEAWYAKQGAVVGAGRGVEVSPLASPGQEEPVRQNGILVEPTVNQIMPDMRRFIPDPRPYKE